MLAALASLLCATIAVAAPPALPSNTTIISYNLSYAAALSPTDGYEHTHLVAALSGLSNRKKPSFFYYWTPSDRSWFEFVTSEPDGWLAPPNAKVITGAEPGNLTMLLSQNSQLMDAVGGVVLYDPAVPATSNVASTIAGVEGWLPVAHRPASGPGTVYSQLVGSGLLKVQQSLVGKFTGSRTGSSKADAYLWAKEHYLDTGKTDPRLIAYYVDYFAATMVPTAPANHGPPPPPPPPPAPAPPATLVEGQQLLQGQSLVSSNGIYSLTLQQADCNLVLTDESSTPKQAKWITQTAGQAKECSLLLTAGGNLQLVALPSANADPEQPEHAGENKVLWQTKTAGTGGRFWLWMQTDGNVVLYKGTCCSGSVLWASNTATPVAGSCSPSSAAFKSSRAAKYQSYKSGNSFVGSVPHNDVAAEAAAAAPPAIEHALTTNQDYFIANKAFFIDLSIWGDEAPIDDPTQPVGTDRTTLLAILESTYNRTQQAGVADKLPKLTHVGGFVPWLYKYVSDGTCGARCKHQGVETEWATACVFSGYNLYMDADACCVGSFGNSALWQQHPLPTKLVQPFVRPTKAALIAKGYVDAATGKVARNKRFAAYYAGDYDSAAWLYSQFRTNFDDPNRGKVPIGWAIDPELSLRFPVIFQYLYNKATQQDVFISGDSGAGYINPTQLFPPRVSKIPTSGAPDWVAWNKEWYSRLNYSFTGFVIQGDAGVMTDAADAMYDQFSPDGIVLSTPRDAAGPSNVAHATKGGTPVFHHMCDFPAGFSVTEATNAVMQFAQTPAGEGNNSPTFGVFRTILQPATYHYQVAQAASAATPNLTWVDPVTLGILAKLEIEAEFRKQDWGSNSAFII